MKVLIFGASGKTGSMVVENAKASGHDVTAFTHGDDGSSPSGVRVISGDAADADAVLRAVAGHEAVIDAIGGNTPWKDSGLEASTARPSLPA